MASSSIRSFLIVEHAQKKGFYIRLREIQVVQKV